MFKETLFTFFLAMTPFGELRLSIPVALTTYHLNFLLTYLISVLGNLIPVAFLLLFLGAFSHFLSKNSKIFQKFFLRLFQKTRTKYTDKIKKYGYLGLTAFVATPLPLTGGWTGALIAFLFGIPFKKAFFSIASGIAISGFIVSFLTKAGIAIEKYFGWQVLFGISLVISLFWLISKRKFKI